MRRFGSNNRGFAVVGSAVIVALALFMGFGAAVIVQRTHLLHQAKLTRQRMSRKSHEFLKVTANRNFDNTTIVTLTNKGSVPSVAQISVTATKPEERGSLHVLGGIGGEGLPVGILEQKSFKISDNIGENKAGVVTRLGNIFWED